MEKDQSPDIFGTLTAGEVARALKKLRRRDGMTLKKLAAQQPILSTPATIAYAKEHKVDVVHAAREVITEKVSNGRGLRWLALQHAFAIAYRGAGETCEERRRDLIAGLEESRTSKTIERYENDAIEELALDLLGGEDLSPSASTRVDVHSLPATPLVEHAPTNWSNPQRYFRTLNLESTTRIRGRVPFENETTRIVEALADGVDRYVARWRYTGDEEVRVEVAEGGRFVRELDRMVFGYRRFEINLERLLKRGQRHRLSYLVSFLGVPELVPYHTITSASGDPKMGTLRVCFDPNMLPKHVYKVVGPSLDFPDPAMPLEEVQVDDRHTATAVFTELIQGYTHGLIWEWA